MTATARAMVRTRRASTRRTSELAHCTCSECPSVLSDMQTLNSKCMHISMAKHCVPLATCAPAQGRSSSGVVKAGKRAGAHAAMWVVGGSAGGGEVGRGGSCSHPRTMSATSPFLSGVRRDMRHCEEGQATRVAASMTRALSVGDGGCIGGEGEPEGRTRPVAAVVARLGGAARRGRCTWLACR
jgi:hypothetical protein